MVGGKVGIKSGWLGWLATSHLSPAAAKNYLREAPGEEKLLYFGFLLPS